MEKRMRKTKNNMKNAETLVAVHTDTHAFYKIKEKNGGEGTTQNITRVEFLKGTSYVGEIYK